MCTPSPYTQDTVLVENLKSLLKTIPDAGQVWFQEPCRGQSVHARASAPDPWPPVTVGHKAPSGQILPLPIHTEPLASPSPSGHVHHSLEAPLSCSFIEEAVKESLPRCVGRCGP